MPPKTKKRTESLIVRTRDLIDGYSSASILKEFLQNSDDSGATKLIVTFDKQNYQKLKGTPYELAMGTSLLLYNNSIFKEKDFDSIVEISAMGKAEDANSTGRFGQGFNSSFSISDHPTFLSHNRVYWFDILKTAVSKDIEYDDILYWEDSDFHEIQNWLETFKVGGFDNSKPYNGTIFRLPLREENNNSKISNEVFTFEDFLIWVEEWKDKAENLLFLRNVHTLILQEINKDGEKIVHLEINTKNSDEIQKINTSIQSEFNHNSLIDICNHWKNKDYELPLFKYRHYFSISYLNRETSKIEIKNETWAIVNGLFRGKDNSLIDKAIEALHITPNPRKVLPWAGVALCLDKNGKPIKKDSQWYTFLPLPIESKYPIQLHGWFDLNPKRTEITYDGTGNDKEILISWNQQLLEYGVGVAWALLIDYIKDEKHLNNYYNFWANKEFTELDKYLIKGFYQKISSLNCFYVYNKNTKPKWLSPKDDLYYFKDEENKTLFESFQKHFSIISPKPKKFIIDNFENINVELTEITPKYIRDYLKEEALHIEFPISSNKININMLKNKKHLQEIIKYCANNGEDYSLLADLPLELTLNQSIYKVESDTLFDKNPNLKLFQDMKQLYIDVDIVNSIDKVDTLPDSWLEPTLKNQIGLLSKTSYWEKLNITKEWIEEVINLIVHSSQEEFDEAEDIILELQIVYQENKEYGKLESSIGNYSPFIPRDEDIENNLVYLDEIEMNVINHEYVEIYKPLLKYDGLITELTSKTLIKHLLQLNNFDFFKKKDTREYILDILTENIGWFDELDYRELNIFDSIAFIETVNNNLYANDTDIKLFLPTGFKPPEHIKSLQGEYELIAVDTNSKLFELYKKMDIDEQSLSNYIEEIIIPFLKNNENILDNKEILKWLIPEWDTIKSDITEEVFEELANSSIIPTLLDEQNLYKASELYLPTIILPNILNNKQHKPINFEDEKIQNNWVVLLKDLGASTKILSQHLESRVVQIVDEEKKEDSIELLNYIANHFETFEDMDILDTLKEYAWFPVKRPNDILKPKSEYTPLKKPSKLILNNDKKIAGGYYHILDDMVKLGKKDERGEITPYDMASKLGVKTNIPNEYVFESFRELMKLSPTNGEVVNYVKEVYKYIGRRFQGQAINFDIEERTILINNQWIAPKYVYQSKINLTRIYSWDNLIGNETESDLAKGLISLGVQEEPTLDFFIEQLKKLPQEQDLNTNQLNDSKELLKKIQIESDEIRYYDNLPLLTPQNQLVLSSSLYINDFPAYKNAKDKNNDLKFCQNQFNPLANKLKVLTLSENYTSKVYKYEDSKFNHKIVEMLEKESFKEAILRLLYNDKKIRKDEVNESLLHQIFPSNLIFVSELVIEYSIENKFLFRSNETTYEDNGELYIFEQEDEDDMISLISEYICDKKDLSRKSFDYIGRILRRQMSREEIQEFLDKKKVIELPQKFDIENDIPLVSNTNDELTYDTSTNQEEDNREFKGEIPPPTIPKQSSEKENPSNDLTNQKRSSSQNNNQSTGETKPPIKAKASYENNNNTSNNSNTNGEGNKSNKKIVSSNDRKPVYVGKDREVDLNQQKSQRESAKEIGDKGENYILVNKETLLLSKTNNFQKAPTNNKGFDIYEKDESGQTIRYIEVKTLTGQWGQGGVGITEHQLNFAQKQKDKWWLFVVENINTNNTKVYQFKNPILEANRFMFDNSWKQLAYKSINIENNEPKVNDKYEIESDGKLQIALVTNIKKRGALFQVDLILENGKEIRKKKFKKSWRKI